MDKDVVEQHKGDVAREPLATRWQKFLAGHIYLGRRVFGYLARVNLWVLNVLSRALGFKFSYEFSDYESWKWFKDWKFPRYRAYVERKN